MPISDLKLTNVGPFDDIEFKFDRQVNVFTGPNNSGKSTVLWALGDISVFPFGFPRKLLREESSVFEVSLWSDLGLKFTGQLPISQGDGNSYWNKERWSEHVNFLEKVAYTNFIPALRQSTNFRSPGPTVNVGQRVEGFPHDELQGHLRLIGHRFSEVEQLALPFNQNQGEPLEGELLKRKDLIMSDASVVSDRKVIQRIIDLDYRSYRLNQPSLRDIIIKIGMIASEITEGFPIHFIRVDEDDRGLFPQFNTPDGDVPLNVLSQGTQSIIQWLAHFLIGYAEYYNFPDSLEEKPGILIVDEIDAHLHPSWQRRIIPTLTRHFPNLQIFCSTYSPLMLAGLKEGQAQLLHRDEKGRVKVSYNERDIIGWSADEILRNFLEVPNPTDLETVKHLERLQELRRKSELSAEEAEELEKLRHTVNQDLMGGPIAAQMERFAEILDQAKAESLISAPVGSTRRRRKPAK